MNGHVADLVKIRGCHKRKAPRSGAFLCHREVRLTASQAVCNFCYYCDHRDRRVGRRCRPNRVDEGIGRWTGCRLMVDGISRPADPILPYDVVGFSVVYGVERTLFAQWEYFGSRPFSAIGASEFCSAIVSKGPAEAIRHAYSRSPPAAGVLFANEWSLVALEPSQWLLHGWPLTRA
jgi:hypothetical protein